MPKDLAQNLNKNVIIHLAICSLTIFLLYLSISNLNHYLSLANVLGASTSNELEQEKKFWEEIVKDSPTYQDGWIELAKVLFELKETNYAVGAYNTAKAINPNNLKLKEVESLFL